MMAVVVVVDTPWIVVASIRCAGGQWQEMVNTAL